MWSRLVSLGELISRLTRILDDRDRFDDEHVIVETTGGHIQFCFCDGLIHGWTVSSDHVLPGDTPFTADQQNNLVRLGWSMPGECDSDGDEQPNFWREWHWSTPSDDIVTDIARTLVVVFMTAEGELLELHGNTWGPSSRGGWTDRIPA